MKTLIGVRNPIGVIYDVVDCKMDNTGNLFLLRLKIRNVPSATTIIKTASCIDGRAKFYDGWEGIYE